MRNPLRRRWVLVIVGQASGNRTPMPFMQYWRLKSAQAMRDRLQRYRGPETRIEVERL